ncbi:glycoside hydrolase family 16 protein [Gorillibacterium sp. sgz500922]|uniref:glycoside hydrolase family 16 protein n=1 Tax=Gorillibacterium sp. sgz500922 TaxID=3446694 RepID=UPI003F67AD4D
MSSVTNANKKGWTLTFEDRFEGHELDAGKWSHCPEEVRHTGKWSDQDAYVDGEGHLVIRISERDGGYYSGAIRSKGKFGQAYGYYEIRCQLPAEEGFWTAFWLMSDGVFEVTEDGKTGTEIDIFESPYFHDSKINCALHWNGYGEHHQTVESAVHLPGIYEGFHTFALEWNETEYIFFADDQEIWRTNAGGISERPAYLKISAEVGPWGGDITKAKLPTALLVDYVRVYERAAKED